MSDEVAIVISIIVLLVMASAGAFGIYLIYRDTKRRSGIWGINSAPVDCPQCGIPVPQIRRPTNVRQALFGGGTCAKCGTEIDKWGQRVDETD